MALSFPNSPTDGELYTDTTSGNRWVWDSANTVWKSTSTFTQTITVSSTQPGSPVVGQLWWSQDYGRLFVYYNDGNSSQWVEANPADQTAGLVFNTANAAYGRANTALQNTSGTFAGSLTVSGNTTIIGQTGQVVNPLKIRFANDYPGAGGASSNTADKMKLVFYDNSPIDIYSIGVGPSADMQYHAYQGTGNGSHNFYTENLNRMKIDGSGRVTKPYQPYFKMRPSWSEGTTYNDGTVIAFGTSVTNNGGHFNTSTYKFTAPIAGLYWFDVCFLTQSSTAIADIRLWINGANPDIYGGYSGNWTGHKQAKITHIIYLSAGDTVDVRPGGSGSTTLNASGMHNWFQGYLLG